MVSLEGMRIRKSIDDNYSAFFTDDGKTYRFKLTDAPMKELTFPEFYDVAINTWCAGGCGYCYVGAKESGMHFPGAVGNIKRIFGHMTLNERPFQVALGGEGEPTAHPDFLEVLETFRGLGIAPNYTTNGMHLSTELIAATKEFNSGVAVSMHPQLRTYSVNAIKEYSKAGIRLNLHFVVSNAKSIDLLWKAVEEWNDVVEHFVVLPYMSNREAPFKRVDTDYLARTLDSREDISKIAFGSNLYKFLSVRDYPVSLYEPEAMSKYLVLSDPIKLYSDSHSMKPVTKGPLWRLVNILSMEDNGV